MKSLIRQRREQGATCSVCRSPDYKMYPPNHDEGVVKPSFKCNQCGHFWMYGSDGGVYARLAEGASK